MILWECEMEQTSGIFEVDILYREKLGESKKGDSPAQKQLKPGRDLMPNSPQPVAISPGKYYC